MIHTASPTASEDRLRALFVERLGRLRALDEGGGFDMMTLDASRIEPLAGETAMRAALHTSCFWRGEAMLAGHARGVTGRVCMAKAPSTVYAPEPARPLMLLPAPEAISVLAEAPGYAPRQIAWRGGRWRIAQVWGPDILSASADPNLIDSIKSRELGPGLVLDPFPSENRFTLFGNGSRASRIASPAYYIAEDDKGRRFWLSREEGDGAGLQRPPHWRLHGLFV
jgi:hypothetical protein